MTEPKNLATEETLKELLKSVNALNAQLTDRDNAIKKGMAEIQRPLKSLEKLKRAASNRLLACVTLVAVLIIAEAGFVYRALSIGGLVEWPFVILLLGLFTALCTTVIIFVRLLLADKE